MLDADDQFPYRLVAPQQDNSTYVRRQPSAVLVADGRTDADLVPGVRLRERADPHGAERQDHLRRLQGRVRPLQRRDRPGAALLDLSAAALRQAAAGHEVPFRAPGADRDRRRRIPKIVYHGSQYVHKTIDGGLHWTRFSPDVTANGTGRSRDVGRADHARHDGRGSLRRAVLDARVAPRSQRVLDRIERRSGVGDEGRRQDVEERDAAAIFRRAAACTRSRIRRTAAARRTSPSIGCI